MDPIEKAVRQEIPKAIKIFARNAAENISQMVNSMKDELYTYGAEHGELSEEGEATGTTATALTTIDHFAHQVINYLLDSNIQVVGSEEELNFIKSMDPGAEDLKDVQHGEES